MEAEALLVAARFIHHGSALVLFGLALFARYAKADWRPRLGVAGLAALVAGLAWFAVTVGTMAGDLSAAADPAMLWSVASSLAFGQVWSVRLLLLLAAIAAAFAPPSTLRQWMVLGLCGLYLAGIALTGHTQLSEGTSRMAHVAADAVHLLAAGAWLGGLIGLAAVLRRRGPEVGLLLSRFSRMGYWAVGLIVVSGLINSFFLVGWPEALWTTTYGQVLLAKLALVAGMAALAMVNRFRLSPRLYAPATAGAAEPWLKQLRRNVLLEQALGALVLAAVALLGTLEPAVNG